MNSQISFKEILTSLRIPLRASRARSGAVALIRDSKGGQNLGITADPGRIRAQLALKGIRREVKISLKKMLNSLINGSLIREIGLGPLSINLQSCKYREVVVPGSRWSEFN